MALPPIRPDAFPTPARPAADAARLAAQRAFFDAALGRAGAPSATPVTAVPLAAPVTATVRAQPVQRLPDPGAEPPARPLRPGSLLDIRV
jgi:hypothetical protein